MVSPFYSSLSSTPKMDRRIDKAIFLSPLDNPQGVRVIRYLGLVRSVIVDTIPPHLEILSILSSARKKRSPVSTFVSSLIHEALTDVQEKARHLGANAVLGLRIEVEHLGWGRILVNVYGTAAEVKV